jgi:hypothetical protein
MFYADSWWQRHMRGTWRSGVGSGWSPESVEEAWAWATWPQHSTTALLQPVTDTNTDAVQVFDYLLDQTQRRAGQIGRVPEQVVTCALRHATAQDAEDIAHVAYTQGRYNLANMLHKLGRSEEAEAERRTALQIQ